MTWANGRAPATSLKLISPGFDLVAPSAASWSNMALIHHMMHDVLVTPASSYGSGYRSLGVQQEFYLAAQGNKAAIEKTHLDPDLHVTIAKPGGSSHGWGTRADTLFNGRSPDAVDIAVAKRYGWTREFGTSDRNHFMHDGKTAISGVRNVDRIKLCAQFFNERHLGRTTKAVDTGDQFDPDMVWLTQHWGHMQHTYPAASPEDGRGGPNTEHSLHLTWVSIVEAWKKAHPTPKA